MARFVPFSMHIRITPDNGSGQLKSKRFENWRDMQKISSLMYEALDDLTTITMAEPGGGQHRSFSGTGRSGMSGLVNGLAVKPQIGETPAQVMIAGFWDDTASNTQPHPEHQRISGGEIYTGPATAVPWDQNPATKVDEMVKALKSAVEVAIDAGLPGGVAYDIFRIDISGVVYGDRGYHFPQ